MEELRSFMARQEQIAEEGRKRQDALEQKLAALTGVEQKLAELTAMVNLTTSLEAESAQGLGSEKQRGSDEDDKFNDAERTSPTDERLKGKLPDQQVGRVEGFKPSQDFRTQNGESGLGGQGHGRSAGEGGWSRTINSHGGVAGRGRARGSSSGVWPGRGRLPGIGFSESRQDFRASEPRANMYGADERDFGDARGGVVVAARETSRENRVPRFTKMDFPPYDGTTEPAEWLQKCEDFFDDQMTAEESKVRQATFVLTGPAHGWYRNLRRMVDQPLTWTEFSEMCMDRFGPEEHANPLGELFFLRQVASVEDYCVRFEACLGRQVRVTTEQSIWFFCVGLCDVIRREVEYHRPESLYAAMKLARKNEIKLIDDRRPRTFGGLPASTSRPPIVNNTSTLKGGVTGQTPRPPSGNPRRFLKKLTSEEITDRRAKGLCFNCDELFAPGHRCKPALFHIVLVEDGQNCEDDDDDLELSLNAIRGEHNAQTFQVRVMVSGKTFWALLDTGSTHNFIKNSAAKELGLTVEHRPGICVALPDGGRLDSSGICRDISLYVQGYEFSADLFAIPLDGFDIVLGIRWLNRLGRIVWDFVAREMEFTLNGETITLHGEVPDRRPKNKQLFHLSDEHTDLGLLLEEFEDIFATPTCLPPPRACDHQIRLLSGTDPVAVRPYRYPHMQKDEIERQCAEMLRTGIIRESHSPFSSPVLLVKKADNSWRF